MQSERKKQLKREYLKTPKAIGAYRIHNRANQKTFVGVSRDVEARMNRHRFELRMGSEELSALQADWHEFGCDAFEFEILETLEPPEDVPAYDPQEDLMTLQTLWCEQLQCYAPLGYNHPASA